MCGITGAISKGKVTDYLLESLQNLEYRGYDSCGIAILNEDNIELKKNIGDVATVTHKENLSSLSSNIGIAHTRWATHGSVTKENAHPHLSNNKKFVLVHNGIFSNYKALKQQLSEKGYSFESETDTEIFVNLVEYEFEKTQDVEMAFHSALLQVEGAFALALLSTYDTTTLYIAKKEAPIILGIGNNTHYIASDINAFLHKTRKMISLDDYEYACITENSYIVKKFKSQEPVTKKIQYIKWDSSMAKRSGFAHYMLKEIFEQPQILKKLPYLEQDKIETIASLFLKSDLNFLVGVGTTYYIALLGSYFFRQYANLYVPAISSDEFSSVIPIEEKQHALFLSQSGETYDTRMALQYAKKNKATTSAIVNVIGSSIATMSDICLYQESGPEICVVSTKAAFSQLLIILQIAMQAGYQKGIISEETIEKQKNTLLQFESQLETLLNQMSGVIHELTKSILHTTNWLFMGKGIYYPIALESSLKMKEVTYLHIEGLPTGFLKHGTLAMIDENIYSLFFMPFKEEKQLYNATCTAIEEVKARKGKIIAFCAEDDFELQAMVDKALILPKSIPSICLPLVELTLAQLLAYYSALHLGNNIDRPRNLAKSVTVG